MTRQRRQTDPDDFDGQRLRNNEEIRATGPGGWGVTIKGRDTVMLLMLAAALAALVWFSYQQHKEIIDEVAGLTYIMSLRPEDRPQLVPPPKLRQRMLRDQ